MTGSSEPSLTERLSKVIHQDDGSHTSTTQETSLSSSSRSSSSTSSLLANDNHKSSRDDLNHDHHDDDLNDLWCRRQQRQRRRRNNSWDTTSLSGTTTLESLSPTTGSDHSTTSTTNNNNNNNRMPLACPLVTRDDYASRRDQRLAALRASRQERLQQKASPSITQIMGSSASLMCMEDHPYYLAQQEQKLQQLKDKVDQDATRTTATTAVCTSNRTMAKAKILPEMHISKDLLEELTCAYQLIHRQRLYLQHLLQQQDAMHQQTRDKTRSLRRSRSSCSSSEATSSSSSSSSSSMIQQLQSQLIQLEHAKVETEFILYNRLTHDTMEYEDRLQHLEIKVEYWQLRSRNERESYRQDLQQAKMRIQELEQALQERQQQQQLQQQQQAETSIPSLSLPTSPGKHGVMNCQKSNVDSSSLVAAHDVLMAVDNNNNNNHSRGGGGGGGGNEEEEEVVVSSPKSLLPLFRPRSLSSDAVSPQQQHAKAFQTRPPHAKPYSGSTGPSLSQADLIKSAMNNQHKKPKRFGVF